MSATQANAMIESRERLHAYMALRAREDEAAFRPGRSEPTIRKWGKRVVPQPLRLRARVIATRIASRREAAKAAVLVRKGSLRLQLGAGSIRKPGWTNVDLMGDSVDLAWDLTQPLPFPDASADAVFHEHLLEHLDLSTGLSLMEECRRALRPGGVVRVGVPDFTSYAESYVQETDWLEAVSGEARPTPLLALQELFYRYGHRTMYDLETLTLVMKAAGFSAPERRLFGDSRLDPCPDSEHRQAVTLYVEATR